MRGGYVGVHTPTYVYADVCVYKNMSLFVLMWVRRQPQPPVSFLGTTFLSFFSLLFSRLGLSLACCSLCRLSWMASEPQGYS